MEAMNEECKAKERQSEGQFLQLFNKDVMPGPSQVNRIKECIENEPVVDHGEIPSDFIEIKEEMVFDDSLLTAPKEKPACNDSQGESTMVHMKSETTHSSLEDGNSLVVTKKDDEDDAVDTGMLEDPLFVAIKEEPSIGDMSDEDAVEGGLKSEDSMEKWTMEGSNQPDNNCKVLVNSCNSDCSNEGREVSRPTESVQICSSNIQVHSQTGKQTLKCSELNRPFTKSSSLVSCTRTRTMERPFKCTECRKTFGISSIFKKHMRNHKRERNFKCTECEKTFAFNSHLKTHMRTHTGERPFKCSKCGKAYTSKFNLVAHMGTHSGERPFMCSECGKVFTGSSQLTKHKRTHIGERPFKCNICGKSFSVKCNLVTHMRSHTGERPFKCTVCDKGFSISTHIVAHMRTHTGERPFKCSKCGKAYTRKFNLVAHIGKHTGD